METLVVPPQEFEPYRLVDAIPEVAAERQAVREHAENILEANRDRADADKSLLLIPVDALSTAASVREAEEAFGFESPERKERWNGLVLDYERYIGEWIDRLGPTAFKPIRHKFVAEEQAYYSHGMSISRMTENALVPVIETLDTGHKYTNHEEERRRINERVGDETVHIVHAAGAIAVGEVIRTVSECTDAAIDSYKVDIKLGRKYRGYRGYVPEIAKIMVYDFSFKADSDDRLEEVIGLPGLYFTHEIIQLELKEGGVNVDHMDKTELHGAQFIARDCLKDYAKRLDVVARREWCNPYIFMGEEVAPDHDMDYDAFFEEAYARQDSIKDLAKTTASFILDVEASGEISRSDAPKHVEDFVKLLLADIGKKDKEAAAVMFDKKTAEGLQEVARLEAASEYEQANRLMKRVMEEAPGGACGAGSCGIEDVGTNELESLRGKLKADPSDKIVRDKERSCKCGKKSIVYAYNNSKVNKFCESCHKFESKRTA